MTDHLSRQLVTLRADYRARALRAPGDHALQDSLSEAYLTQTMLLLSAAYGHECARQVHASAPWRPGPGAARSRLTAALLRYWSQWFAAWSAAGRLPGAR